MKLTHSDNDYQWNDTFTIWYWSALLAAILLILMIAGCSTMQLSQDATAAQKKAALCSDAQMGYALSSSIMATQSMTPEQAKYWAAYQTGAALALQTYCPGTP
jgi:hypothetical protein